MGWGGDLDSSREFKPIPKPSRMGLLTNEGGWRVEEDGEDEAPASPPMPRIVIRLAAVFVVLKEKDPGIQQFGGEPTKVLAFNCMRTLSQSFFETSTSLPSADKFNSWHADMARTLPDSHVQLVGSPLTVVYEEGTSIGPDLASAYAAITKVTLGKMSVVECLVECDSTRQHEIVPLLRFQGSTASNKHPDFKLVYKDTFNSDDLSPVSSISLTLNPCRLEIDPGFVDRTFLLFNYAEMDPNCLKSSMPPSLDVATSANLDVQINCSSVKIAFHIPKPDMRSPSEIGPDFLRTFWTRKIHPELYLLEMEGFGLHIQQAGGAKAPLEISFFSQTLEASCQEAPGSIPLMLLQARRLASESMKKSYAMEIGIKICMDDSLKLQGRFNSNHHNMQKSVFVKKDSVDLETENYFVVDPDTGNKNMNDKSAFIQQLADIMAALEQSLHKNNLFLDIKFDAVSLVLQNKRVYELIYNRIGNDMLLWVPAYFTVKEHIYGERLFNPLEDDSQEFSSSFSGRSNAPLDYEKEPVKHTNAFPKDAKVGPFEIHTDTAVSLTVNQVQLLVCLPLESNENSLGLIHFAAVGLALISASGLDKEPEIAVFNLRCEELCVKFGEVGKNSLPAQLHFNPDIGNLEVLVTTNAYCDKAWLHKPAETELLNLTSKILLDSRTNLKSIQLAFKITEAGLCIRNPASSVDWINALADFFTVVDFPVVGYVPPEVLTELHFVLNHCAVELSPPSAAPAKATLCLGKVKVTCSLLDTTQDASVNVAIEDASLFLTKEAHNPVESALCIADIDYFDIQIALTEPGTVTEDLEDSKEKREANLAVSANCNLVRVRTCADTLQLLVTVFAGFSDETGSSGTSSLPVGDVSVEEEVGGSESEDQLLPDLEDAMEELTQKEEASSSEAVSEDRRSRKEPGTQVFFFPDEGGASLLPPAPPIADLMTQSIYVENKKTAASDDDFSDDDFCILEEEEGSGIIPSSGEPTIRVLDAGGIRLENNYFAPPQESLDHLRAPKSFPVSTVKLALTKISLVWQIFGGNDLSDSKEMKCNTKATLQKYGLAVAADRKKLPASSRPGTSSARHISETLKTKGGPGRNKDALIELSIYKMAAQHETYPLTGGSNAPVSRQILLIPNLEIRDRLVESEINKLLHSFGSKARPKQSSAHMISIKSLTVRPDPDSDLEETSLKVSMQPFRINIDQDTLFFLIDFTNSFMPPDAECGEGQQQQQQLQAGVRGEESRDRSGSIKYTSGMQAIKMQVPEGTEVYEDARSSPPKLEDDEELQDESNQPRSKSSTPGPAPSPANNIYFKSFIFSPSVPIRIDYVGKYVDMSQGALTGLLAGLAQLNCSEITLRQLDFKQGILGLDKLLALAATAWLADIRGTQLPALLGGVGPMHALLQMVTGLKDLFFMPIEQYRKDGRIVRGLQRGTNSFTHSTTLSILEVTNKLLSVVKFAAELAFDVMSPEGCVVQGKLPHPARNCHRRAGRSGLRRARGTPHDMREGMIGAMALVREGLDETARSLADAATDRAGMAGAVGGVLRAVPSTMVRPVILGAAATSNLLDGVKNQISPDQRLEEEDKWKTS